MKNKFLRQAAKALACAAVALSCAADASAAVAKNAATKKKISFTSATKKLATTPVKATAGKSFSLKIGVKPATSGLKFIVSGLPKGLSIDKTTGEITGKPTKPGNFIATVTVRAGSKVTPITQRVKFKVSVPSWAKGTFNGYAFPDGGNKPGGYLTFTVGSTGKVSGKVTYKGVAYPFTSKYTYCSAKKAKFTPKKMKLGTKTLDPGLITVKVVDDFGRIRDVSVVEAVDVTSTYIAQKPAGLVCPGGVFKSFNGYKYTFKARDEGSGLGSDDSLKIKMENDAVMVSGFFGGKKLAESSIPLFVTGYRKSSSGDIISSLSVYIYDHKAKYRKWLFFDITMNGDKLMNFDTLFRD